MRQDRESVGALAAVESVGDSRIRRVIESVLSDLEQPHSLSAAAACAGLARTYFCKLFVAATGVRFSTWNALVRVERAKALLSEVHVNVLDVAAAVGFRDVRTFERQFKRLTGVAPGAYRKQLRAIQKTTNAAHVEHVAEQNHAQAES